MIKIKIHEFVSYKKKTDAPISLIPSQKLDTELFVTGNAGKQVLFIRWPKLSHTLY
jgi:hypothetical protein